MRQHLNSCTDRFGAKKSLQIMLSEPILLIGALKVSDLYFCFFFLSSVKWFNDSNSKDTSHAIDLSSIPIAK